MHVKSMTLVFLHRMQNVVSAMQQLKMKMIMLAIILVVVEMMLSSFFVVNVIVDR